MVAGEERSCVVWAHAPSFAAEFSRSGAVHGRTPPRGSGLVVRRRVAVMDRSVSLARRLERVKSSCA
jgi:hypothetical protein